MPRLKLLSHLLLGSWHNNGRDSPAAPALLYGLTVLAKDENNGTSNASSPCPNPFAPCVGYDRGGDDIKVFPQYTGNISDCEALCNDTSACMAWTWCGVGSAGPGPRCCLKSAVPDMVGAFDHMACGINKRAAGHIPPGAIDFNHTRPDEDGGGVRVGYDVTTQTVGIGGGGGGSSSSNKWAVSTKLVLNEGEGLQLHVFVDGNLIEVVANGRASVVYAQGGLAQDATAVHVFGTTAATFDAWVLGSIW